MNVFQIIFYILSSIVFVVWLNTTASNYVIKNKQFFLNFRALLNTFIFGMWTSYALLPAGYVTWSLLQILNTISLFFNVSTSYIFSNWKNGYDTILALLSILLPFSVFAFSDPSTDLKFQLVIHFLLTIFTFSEQFAVGPTDHEVQIIVDRKKNNSSFR